MPCTGSRGNPILLRLPVGNLQMPVPNRENDLGNLEKEVVPRFPSPHLERSVRGDAVPQVLMNVLSTLVPLFFALFCIANLIYFIILKRRQSTTDK